MPSATKKTPPPAALFLVAFLGVVLGNLSLPFLSPNLAQAMGSASLRFSLFLTGRLHTATIVPQIHFVASAVGGLLALALWEFYHCLLPQQQARIAQTVLLPLRHFLLRIITISLLFAIVVSYGIFNALHTYVPAPSDDVLIANFHQNRQSFEQVRRMLNDTPQLEPVTTTSIDGSDGAGILSLEETRYATYQAQLAAAGLKDAHLSSLSVGSRDFRFELPPPMSDTEARATHEIKSYIYCESPPDSTWRDMTPRTYRHIEGKWYLCIRSRAQ